MLESQSSKMCQICNCGWDVSSEAIERQIEEVESRGERGRYITRDVVMLEVDVLERRKREHIGWKVPTEAIRPETENFEAI